MEKSETIPTVNPAVGHDTRRYFRDRWFVLTAAVVGLLAPVLFQVPIWRRWARRFS
jgi:hypothetical protein